MADNKLHRDHPDPDSVPANAWSQKYRQKHRWRRITEFPLSIVPPKRVRIYQQNDYYRLQFWDPATKKNLTERVNGDLVAAIARAREIDERIRNFRSSGMTPRGLRHRDLIEAFSADLRKRADAGEISTKTVTRYASALGHYQGFAEQSDVERRFAIAATVNREFVLDLQSYLSNLPISPNGHSNTRKRRMVSPRYVLDVVRAMFAWAADPLRGNQLAAGFPNPFLGSHGSRADVASDPFGQPDITLEMAGEFLLKCDSYQLPIFALLAMYGLRASEPCFLFREDLNSGDWLVVYRSSTFG